MGPAAPDGSEQLGAWYWYVGNNPIRFVDPTGGDQSECFDINRKCRADAMKELTRCFVHMIGVDFLILLACAFGAALICILVCGGSAGIGCLACGAVAGAVCVGVTVAFAIADYCHCKHESDVAVEKCRVEFQECLKTHPY